MLEADHVGAPPLATGLSRSIASASALVAALFNGKSAVAMTALMAICSILSVLTYLYVVVPGEQRAHITVADSIERPTHAIREHV